MKERTIKFVKAIAVIVGCFLMFSTCVFAGTSFSSYNVDVPKLGGHADSGTQKKAYQGRSGEIKATYVGGGYTITCRLRDVSNGTEGAAASIKTGRTATLYSRASHKAGDTMCVRFYNNLTTFVDVNSSGKWRSDKPTS